MSTKLLPRPRDPIALAKLIGDIATGQAVDAVEDGKDPAAAELGRMGGAIRSGTVQNLGASVGRQIWRREARAGKFGRDD
jgi:hypothetical protein